MHYCNICNYFAASKSNLNTHNNTLSHLSKCKNEEPINTYFCKYCNKNFQHKSSYIRHSKLCKSNEENNNLNEILHLELELIKKDCELVKKDCELELEKKQREIDRLTYEKELAIKENKNLQINNINGNNNTINNKYTKIENLNINFPMVLDMKTFIHNYKTDYGLTQEQTRILLENSKNGGIDSCISTLSFYLRESAIKQYNDFFTFKTKIDKTNSVFPYILYDMSLREHYEKFESGKWNRVKQKDNLKALITITDDQVYKHQNEFLHLKNGDKKKIINGLLGSSSYHTLQELDPELYKSNNLISKKQQDSKNNITPTEKKTIKEDIKEDNKVDNKVDTKEEIKEEETKKIVNKRGRKKVIKDINIQQDDDINEKPIKKPIKKPKTYQDLFSSESDNNE